MIKHPKQKGLKAERELKKIIEERGHIAKRSPASLDEDILAVIHGKPVIIEVKAKNSEYLYLEDFQLDKLIEKGLKTNCKPVVAWRWVRSEWYFIYPHQFNRTKKNRYSIKRSKVIEECDRIDEFEDKLRYS